MLLCSVIGLGAKREEAGPQRSLDPIGQGLGGFDRSFSRLPGSSYTICQHSHWDPLDNTFDWAARGKEKIKYNPVTHPQSYSIIKPNTSRSCQQLRINIVSTFYLSIKASVEKDHYVMVNRITTLFFNSAEPKK